MARMSGVIVAIVMAVLLGLTIYGTTKPDNVVLPTGGVMGGTPDAVPVGEKAGSILRARARLQEWRTVSGPSPSAAASPAITGKPIPVGQSNESPAQEVKSWESRQAGDWQYLHKAEYEKGKSSLPQEFASVMVQPQGREWRRRHNEAITFGGGDVIFGTTLFLALFLAFRGRIRIAEGPSGETVERFSPVERANHWVTATSFVVMALTGLVILYGQYLIRPWLGAGPYGSLASASAYTHVAFAIPFVIGVCIMVALWVRQNILNWVDWNWLKRGGGFLSRKHEGAPAERFNAGQKLIFWAVVLSTVALLASGLALVFPLLWLGVVGMQWAQMVHAVVALLMIAVIIGHIYIGTVGMEGAFNAMWSGMVDRNWAKEHHRIWFERVFGTSSSKTDEEPTARAGGAS